MNWERMGRGKDGPGDEAVWTLHSDVALFDAIDKFEISLVRRVGLSVPVQDCWSRHLFFPRRYLELPFSVYSELTHYLMC